MAPRSRNTIISDCDRRRFLARLGLLMLGAPLAGCSAPPRRSGADHPPPPDPAPAAVAQPEIDQGHAPDAEGDLPQPDPSQDKDKAAPSDEVQPAVEDTGLHASPDLRDDRVGCYVAGIRPYRRSGIRVAIETIGNTKVVHNYGHGGAGVTMSFGSAHEVLTLVRTLPRPRTPIVVLGSGVCGLTTALILVQAGFETVVRSASFPPDTTSDVAGGQFAPSLVGTGRNSEERQRFDRMLRRSFHEFMRLEGHEFGIHQRPNFIAGGGGGGLRRLPRELLGPEQRYDRLPFEADLGPGSMIPTLLIEPPVFMPRLMHECRRLGVHFEHGIIDGRDAVAALSASIAINCLGARADLITDDELVPIRGQLVHMKSQDLPYLLSHRNGYIFPRSDAIVLGGSFERGVRDRRPTDSTCRRILRSNQQLFGNS